MISLYYYFINLHVSNKDFLKFELKILANCKLLETVSNINDLLLANNEPQTEDILQAKKTCSKFIYFLSNNGYGLICELDQKTS